MKLFILFFLAYLLGSIPSGVWIGKIFYHKDIRQYGSGNMGTTNTFRVLGTNAGVVVFIMDVLKGMVATLLPTFFHLNINPLYFGLLAVLGHTFPIFVGFKGGKAVATSAGLILGYAPIFFLISFLVFLGILYLTSTVSIASISIALFVTLGSIVFPEVAPFILPKHDWLFTLILFLLTIFIIYRHKDNLIRIKNGTENRVSFGLRKQPKNK